MIQRSNIKLKGDPKKVILQFLDLGEKRTINIIERVLTLDEKIVWTTLNKAYEEFKNRHRFMDEQLFDYFEKVKKYIPNPDKLTNDQKMLVGAYFSKEYSIESAALFNPSIVPHPIQDSSNADDLKFILSLRATGEGHISSIEFREGKISGDGEIKIENEANLSTLPHIYDSNEDLIEKRKLRKYLTTEEINDVLCTNYSCEFDSNIPLSERVLFPYSESEKSGMEDVRLVKFDQGDKDIYYGTYTAYNGKTFRTQLIETENFEKYQISTMYGNAVHDKGLALFPRKINGKYVFTSRQDGENLYLMNSDYLYYWNETSIIKTPQHPWEYIQMGNCGSPIETEHGWLLITHAVGPFRKYVISALLLDLENPQIVVGVLNEPLIAPNNNEREGYVPNVVYSCGSLIHNEQLILPYAMSDTACGFAKISVNELIKNIDTA